MGQRIAKELPLINLLRRTTLRLRGRRRQLNNQYQFISSSSRVSTQIVWGLLDHRRVSLGICRAQAHET